MLFSDDGIRAVLYEETEQFALTKDFLLNREQYLEDLLVFGDEDDARR